MIVTTTPTASSTISLTRPKNITETLSFFENSKPEPTLPPQPVFQRKQETQSLPTTSPITTTTTKPLPGKIIYILKH